MSANHTVSGHRQRPASASYVKGALVVALMAGSCILPLVKAQAADGWTFDLGDGVTFTVGTGVRSSVSAVSAFAPSAGYAGGGDGQSTIARYNQDDFRIYSNLSLNQYIKATVNTERAPSGPVRILDAYGQIEPMDEVNVWVGQMLPPSDRANLDGPFYLSEWYYPGVVSQYPSRFFGRDLGGTVWGKLFDKKIVYSVGIFAGHNRGPGLSPVGPGLSNVNQNPLFAARIAYNFWDPEPAPAYYTGSTYYGKADILTIAAVGMFEKDGVGTAVHAGNYGAWNIDGLMEKKLGDYGVFTLEGAYYNYNTGGVADVPPGFNGAGNTANVGGITQGDGYLASAAYLIPVTVGWGQFQPYARYQEFVATLANTENKQYDIGVNYVLKGHDAVITLDYANNSGGNIRSSYRWVLGVQVQL